jgi:hypothetical protein
MSPHRTFHNCGSSSRLVRRRKEPTRVSRGSSRQAHTAPVSRSASSAIVRSFNLQKTWPSRPMRCWRWKIGVPARVRIASDMAASTGAANSKPTDAIPTSNARHCDDHLACTAQVQHGFQLLVAFEQPARRARAGSSRRRARADDPQPELRALVDAVNDLTCSANRPPPITSAAFRCRPRRFTPRLGRPRSHQHPIAHCACVPDSRDCRNGWPLA